MCPYINCKITFFVPKCEGGMAVWRLHFDRMLNGLHWRHVALGTLNENTTTEEERKNSSTAKNGTVAKTGSKMSKL